MTETKQIGPRVPPEVWEMFKEFSQEKHGKHGKTSEELTEAMIQHMQPVEESREVDADEVVRQLEMLNSKMDYLLTAVGNIPKRDEFVPEAQEEMRQSSFDGDFKQ